jgi:SAM-dependent methyltransferase
MPSNPFATDDMAAGYATARPPVHPEVLRLAFTQRHRPVARAIDIGCGAGLSTAALAPFAQHSIGLEPAVPMLQWHRTVAPHSDFLAAQAERLPFSDSSASLLTAAGSLNYVQNLNAFFAEATRVLAPQGEILVYDFSPGRAPFLEPWFEAFHRLYPPPASEALFLDPRVLASLNPGFQLAAAQSFRLPLFLTRSFFLEYMLTETNVAAAVRRGAPLSSIRAWCESSLETVWRENSSEIHFSGYFAFLAPVRS